MADNRRIIRESLLGNLQDFYQDNPQAQSYIATNISTPQNFETFATVNNIQINYEAPNMQLVTESFKTAINKNLRRL